MNYDNNINDLNLVIHVITKDEIINKDIECINNVLEDFRTDTNKSKNKVVIIFDGYNEDEREIFEIEEIRQFVSKLFNSNHDLFYFLSDIQNSSQMILACLGAVKEKKIYDNTHMGFTLDLDDELRRNIMKGIITICDDDNEAKKLVKELFGYDSWTV